MHYTLYGFRTISFMNWCLGAGDFYFSIVCIITQFTAFNKQVKWLHSCQLMRQPETGTLDVINASYYYIPAKWYLPNALRAPSSACDVKCKTTAYGRHSKGLMNASLWLEECTILWDRYTAFKLVVGKVHVSVAR